jgi:hypothetical protein
MSKNYGKKNDVRYMANGGYMRAGELAEIEPETAAPSPAPSPSPAPAPAADIPDASPRESVGRMDGLDTESNDAANERTRESRRSTPTSAPKPRPTRKAAPKSGGSSKAPTQKASQSFPSGLASGMARGAEAAKSDSDGPLMRGLKAAANWLTSPHGSKITYRPAEGAKSIYAMANGGVVGGGRKTYGK